MCTVQACAHSVHLRPLSRAAPCFVLDVGTPSNNVASGPHLLALCRRGPPITMDCPVGRQANLTDRPTLHTLHSALCTRLAVGSSRAASQPGERGPRSHGPRSHATKQPAYMINRCVRNSHSNWKPNGLAWPAPHPPPPIPTAPRAALLASFLPFFSLFLSLSLFLPLLLLPGRLVYCCSSPAGQPASSQQIRQ